MELPRLECRVEYQTQHDTLYWLYLMQSMISVLGFGFNHPVQLFDVMNVFHMNHALKLEKSYVCRVAGLNLVLAHAVVITILVLVLTFSLH